MKLTPTRVAALRALERHGGEGVRTDRMTLLAAGAELGHGDDDEGDRIRNVDFFAWSSTWLALLRAGYLEEVGHRRYRLTDAGRAAAARGRPP